MTLPGRIFTRQLLLVSATALVLTTTITAAAGPRYEQDPKELESILEDLLAWWPGEWSNAPQVHHQRTVRMPAEGEHEPWYRTFARIDAPQIGPYVIYGQINIGGRDGPLYPRSQVIYKISLDKPRSVVLVRGQALIDGAKFVNLQDHPELWSSLSMRESDIKCDFIWRRDGEQIVGVLDGPTPERRKGGPGTCTYQASGNRKFFADAEWTLTPETFWLYDINLMDGQRFIGREDRTHTKLYRARPYTCAVQDSTSTRDVSSNDRGGHGTVSNAATQSREWVLLRALYPAADGHGLDDQLRLTLREAGSTRSLHEAVAPPGSAQLTLTAEGVSVRCRLAPAFGPMPATAGS